MSNQLIIDSEYKESFSNLLHNEKFKNILIITSRGNQKRGYQDSFIKIINEHKCQHLIYQVNKYPDLEEIDEIFKNFSNSNIDLVLSIGGGSVLDIGKIFATCNIPEEKLNNVSSIKERSSEDQNQSQLLNIVFQVIPIDQLLFLLENYVGVRQVHLAHPSILLVK